MIRLKRTSSSDSNFIGLVNELDRYLKIVDGKENDFYHQFNGIENINYVVVAYKNNMAVGCGAIKQYENDTMEIKRMYVKESFRGQGIATIILNELENWAKELGFAACILETGSRQKAAVRLYKKNNYFITQNYGQYANVENSFCFKKLLL